MGGIIKIKDLKDWKDGINQVICGDCIDLMRMMPDNCVDLVLTDPPYAIGTTSNGNQGNWLDNNLIRPFFDLFFTELKRILKDGGQFYINTDWRTYPFLYPILVQKMNIKNCIVWDYEWIKAGSHFRFSHEFIIYGINAESNITYKRTFPANERDVWRIPPINFTTKKNHGAEKPIPLLNKCLELSSKETYLIFDGFMGSWTTARACKDLGRNFIGCELSENYCKIGLDRLRQTNLL